MDPNFQRGHLSMGWLGVGGWVPEIFCGSFREFSRLGGWIFFLKQMSNEKNLGWLGYIGDETLPSYIRHYNKPL